uniref:Potassium transporter KefB n=1 Tax=Desulfobacca acetoxidans TaxID=60893 RepID=A0A7V4LC85_9BACT
MQILFDLLIVYILAVLVIFVCHRLGIPPLVGFIFTGVLAGPQALGLINAVHEVEILAEIGVILLLFTIGIEFSFANLFQLRRSVLLGGPLQVGLTGLLFFWLAWKPAGLGVGESVFVGFLMALSSTAIVLKVLQSRAEVETPHGNTSLGILIFQDIIIVPMMLFIPFLAGVGGDEMGRRFLFLLLEGALIVGAVILAAKYVVPQVLYQIARTRDREIFLLSVLVLCFAVAWATASAGLSLALGAFLAGLILSETEYSHQALGNILPFRDIFSSIFFISIGMLLNVEFLLQKPLTIVILGIVVLAAKTLLAGGVTLLLGYPLRTAIIVGLTLGQVGEFSFVLAKAGMSQGLFSGDNYQLFLDVTVLTMVLTPFLITLAPQVADLTLRLPWPSSWRVGSLLPAAPTAAARDHLIIVGFGVTGRNLARAAQAGGIPYVIIEMNPETVRTERRKGEPIFFGDATNPEVLEHAHLRGARIVVIAINDPAATRRITELVRKLHPTVHLLVRTRYLLEMPVLYELGADEVIPEEFETSVEIFTRVLRKYLLPRDEIERFIQEVRSEGYRMLRSLPREGPTLADLRPHLKDMEITTVRVAEGAPLAGKTLAEMELRKKYGLTVLALRRNGGMVFNPDPELQLAAGDLLIILGAPEKIAQGCFLFRETENCNL